MMLRPLFAALALSAATGAAAFSFSFNNPTQCDSLKLSWSGGQAPYSLSLFPLFGSQRNISIPDSAYANGKGAFNTTVPFPKGQQFLITMSDATGFNSGGTTAVLTTGSSLGGSCNTTDPGVDFDFELNIALVQCRTYTFSDYTDAVQPVTIYAIVPGGNVSTFHPPNGPTSFDWTADAAAGTSFVFAMVDAQGRQGGSSDLKLVGASDTTNCLDSSAPSTTSNAPSATSTVKPSSSSSPSGSGGPTGAVIAGIIIGVIVACITAGTLGVFCYRRRRAAGSPYPNRHSRKSQPVDLLNPDGGTAPHMYAYPYPGDTAAAERMRGPFDDPEQPGFLPAGHEPEPYLLTNADTAPPPFDPYSPVDTHTELAGPNASAGDRRSRLTSMSSSGARRKAAMAGSPSYHTPARFILHTDADEPQPNDDGFIELPPQYNPGRKPAPMPTLGAPAVEAERATSPIQSQSQLAYHRASEDEDPFAGPPSLWRHPPTPPPKTT